jgi:hypothetical protein
LEWFYFVILLDTPWRIGRALGIIRDENPYMEQKPLRVGNGRGLGFLDYDNRKARLLKRIVADLQDNGWLVWNPSELDKNTIFDLAAMPPKGGGSISWDRSSMMAFTAIIEDNLDDVDLCRDEAKKYRNVVPVFVREDKDSADEADASQSGRAARDGPSGLR